MDINNNRNNNNNNNDDNEEKQEKEEKPKGILENWSYNQPNRSTSTKNDFSRHLTDLFNPNNNTDNNNDNESNDNITSAKSSISGVEFNLSNNNSKENDNKNVPLHAMFADNVTTPEPGALRKRFGNSNHNHNSHHNNHHTINTTSSKSSTNLSNEIHERPRRTRKISNPHHPSENYSYIVTPNNKNYYNYNNTINTRDSSNYQFTDNDDVNYNSDDQEIFDEFDKPGKSYNVTTSDPAPSRIRFNYTETNRWKRMFLFSFASFGIMFGDLTTSPLYTFSTWVNEPPDEETVIGLASCIVWALIIMSIKYTFIYMYANDNGEGGCFAIYSVLCRNLGINISGQKVDGDMAFDRTLTTYTTISSYDWNFNHGLKIWKNRYAQYFIIVLVFLGSAFSLGDIIVTPAVTIFNSLNSINNRMEQDSSNSNVAFPLAIVLTSLLFILQYFTIFRDFVKKAAVAFSPLVIIWILSNASIGIYLLSVNGHWWLFRCFNPRHMWRYFTTKSVILAVSGSEFIYSEMGHFSVSSLQITTWVIVVPALIFTYLGQASALLVDPTIFDNVYWKSVPYGVYVPMSILAVLVGLITAQIAINSLYALIHQAMSINAFPPFKVTHTSTKLYGQIFIPQVNWIMGILSVSTIIAAKRPILLANAYGLSSATYMMFMSFLFCIAITEIWNSSFLTSLLFLAIFGTLDAIMWYASFWKLPYVGWITWIFSALFFIVMMDWRFVTVNVLNVNIPIPEKGARLIKLLASDTYDSPFDDEIIHLNGEEKIKPLHNHSKIKDHEHVTDSYCPGCSVDGIDNPNLETKNMLSGKVYNIADMNDNKEGLLIKIPTTVDNIVFNSSLGDKEDTVDSNITDKSDIHSRKKPVLNHNKISRNDISAPIARPILSTESSEEFSPDDEDQDNLQVLIKAQQRKVREENDPFYKEIGKSTNLDTNDVNNNKNLELELSNHALSDNIINSSNINSSSLLQKSFSKDTQNNSASIDISSPILKTEIINNNNKIDSIDTDNNSISNNEPKKSKEGILHSEYIDYTDNDENNDNNINKNYNSNVNTNNNTNNSPDSGSNLPSISRKGITPDMLVRIPGMAMFYSNRSSGIPTSFYQFLETIPALQKIVIFVHIRRTTVPFVLPNERLQVDNLPYSGLYEAILTYGYMDAIEDGETLTDIIVARLVAMEQRLGPDDYENYSSQSISDSDENNNNENENGKSFDNNKNNGLDDNDHFNENNNYNNNNNNNHNNEDSTDDDDSGEDADEDNHPDNDDNDYYDGYNLEQKSNKRQSQQSSVNFSSHHINADYENDASDEYDASGVENLASPSTIGSPRDKLSIIPPLHSTSIDNRRIRTYSSDKNFSDSISLAPFSTQETPMGSNRKNKKSLKKLLKNKDKDIEYAEKLPDSTIIDIIGNEADKNQLTANEVHDLIQSNTDSILQHDGISKSEGGTSVGDNVRLELAQDLLNSLERGDGNNEKNRRLKSWEIEMAHNEPSLTAGVGVVLGAGSKLVDALLPNALKPHNNGDLSLSRTSTGFDFTKESTTKSKFKGFKNKNMGLKLRKKVTSSFHHSETNPVYKSSLPNLIINKEDNDDEVPPGILATNITTHDRTMSTPTPSIPLKPYLTLQQQKSNRKQNKVTLTPYSNTRMELDRIINDKHKFNDNFSKSSPNVHRNSSTSLKIDSVNSRRKRRRRSGVGNQSNNNRSAISDDEGMRAGSLTDVSLYSENDDRYYSEGVASIGSDNDVKMNRFNTLDTRLSLRDHPKSNLNNIRRTSLPDNEFSILRPQNNNTLSNQEQQQLQQKLHNMSPKKLEALSNEDKEDLLEHVNRMIIKDNDEAAKQTVTWHEDTFAKDDLLKQWKKVRERMKETSNVQLSDLEEWEDDNSDEDSKEGKKEHIKLLDLYKPPPNIPSGYNLAAQRIIRARRAGTTYITASLTIQTSIYSTNNGRKRWFPILWIRRLFVDDIYNWMLMNSSGSSTLYDLPKGRSLIVGTNVEI